MYYRKQGFKAVALKLSALSAFLNRKGMVKVKIQLSFYNFTVNSKEVKDKDETGSNPEGEEATSSKPQSAGANIKDAAQRILTLCQKAEWAPIDQILKSMEKAISSGGEEVNLTPLAGVADLVGVLH